MKLLQIVALSGWLAVSANAAPEFVGVLVSDGTTYVAVRTEDQGGVRWTRIGDAIGEYRAMAYDSNAEVLSLKKGDAEIRLTLKNSTVQLAPSLALLESLVKNGSVGLEEVRGLRTLMERRDKAAAALEDALKSQAAADRVRDLRRQLSIEESNADYLLQSLVAVAQGRGRTRG